MSSLFLPVKIHTNGFSPTGYRLGDRWYQSLCVALSRSFTTGIMSYLDLKMATTLKTWTSMQFVSKGRHGILVGLYNGLPPNTLPKARMDKINDAVWRLDSTTADTVSQTQSSSKTKLPRFVTVFLNILRQASRETANSQSTWSNYYSFLRCCIFMHFHWGLFPAFPLTIWRH